MNYTLEFLPQPVFRGGTLFNLVIRRNFATSMENENAVVFYFIEEDEARECFEKLTSK